MKIISIPGLVLQRYLDSMASYFDSTIEVLHSLYRLSGHMLFFLDAIDRIKGARFVDPHHRKTLNYIRESFPSMSQVAILDNRAVHVN